MERKRVVVSGDVQGVFFRDTCLRTATQHRVAGWVRNLPDGTVEAVFEGTSQRVALLVDWACEGPATSIVKEASVHDEEPEGLTGFEIRPTPH